MGRQCNEVKTFIFAFFSSSLEIIFFYFAPGKIIQVSTQFIGILFISLYFICCHFYSRWPFSNWKRKIKTVWSGFGKFLWKFIIYWVEKLLIIRKVSFGTSGGRSRWEDVTVQSEYRISEVQGKNDVYDIEKSQQNSLKL